MTAVVAPRCPLLGQGVPRGTGYRSGTAARAVSRVISNAPPMPRLAAGCAKEAAVTEAEQAAAAAAAAAAAVAAAAVAAGPREAGASES